MEGLTVQTDLEANGWGVGFVDCCVIHQLCCRTPAWMRINTMQEVVLIPVPSTGRGAHGGAVSASASLSNHGAVCRNLP